jgi:hypothetical protein
MDKYKNINNVKLLNKFGENSFDSIFCRHEFEINVYNKFIDDYGLLCMNYKKRHVKKAYFYINRIGYISTDYEKIKILNKYFGIIGTHYDIYNFIYSQYSYLIYTGENIILNIATIIGIMDYYGILCAPSFIEDINRKCEFYNKNCYNEFYKYSEPIHINKLIIIYGKY